MKGTRQPKIKICCISSIVEAQIAIECGADALGLVGNMPSGPGIISNEKIRNIVRTVPSPIATFLLTSETDAAQLLPIKNRCIPMFIQIVDELQSGTYQQIKSALPNVKLVQVIHVIDEQSVKEAIRISSNVDVLLLDSGNPNLEVKQLGGTGRAHNWVLSRQIRESIDIPLFLAGGLNENNVREAIEYVQPFGVDLCSGVRTDGKLNRAKLEAFIAACRI